MSRASATRIRVWRSWLCRLAIVAATGCSSAQPRQAAVAPLLSAAPRSAIPATLHSPERLPPVAFPPEGAATPVDYGARLVSHDESLDGDLPSELPEPIDAVPVGSGYPIDLPTALRLADGSNLQIAYAREQVEQAYARNARSRALWLPSLRGGASYNRHEGAIQDVVGNQFNTSRGAFYTGAGASGYGAGSPSVPGAVMNFHLADALFQPLATRQYAASRQRAAQAAANDTLWQVSLAYLELLRASQEAIIAADTLHKTSALQELTSQYARTGEGLQADADRAEAELALRRNDAQRSGEAVSVASARLAQLVRLDPTIALHPVEPTVVPIELTPADMPVCQLVGLALANRPELSEQQYLIGEASQRLRREQYAPYIPSVVVATSYGGMSAGVNANAARLDDRLDMDAIAYWELRNLGMGDQAARREARSSLRQSQLRNLQIRDLVAREVVEAHAQSLARWRQIETAQQGIRAAMHSYERNLDRIRDAQGLPLEVLQSIQALNLARRDYLRALIDFNVAQFTLYRAIGWPGQALHCRLVEEGASAPPRHGSSQRVE